MKLQYIYIGLILLYVIDAGAFNYKRLSGSTVQRPGELRSTIFNFTVIDLFTKVSREDVERAVNAVSEQVEKDWAPIWGSGAKYKLLKRGCIPSAEETKNTVIVYLVDALSPAGINDYTGGISAHWNTLPPPNDLPTGDGPQPQFMIGPQIPLVPYGTPVIIIPFGDQSVPYGLQAVLSPIGQFFFPGFTVSQIVSVALSHETLETLGDIFDGFTFAGAWEILTPTATNVTAYIREVCDPVFMGFNTYERNNVPVSDFVTPQWFNVAAQPGTRFDFQCVVKQPLTPYYGLADQYVFYDTGSLCLNVVESFPPDPNVINTVLALTVFGPPCPATKIQGKKVNARMRPIHGLWLPPIPNA